MPTNIAGQHRRAFDIAVPAQCRDLIERGALVAVNHSGGKDSQTMTILLSRIVPREQLVIVHAPLGEAEWTGTVSNVPQTIPPSVPLIMARTASGKSLLERVEESKSGASGLGFARDSAPGIRKERQRARATPLSEGPSALRTTPRQRHGIAPRRDPRPRPAHSLALHERMSVAGREVYDWLPVFELSTDDVLRIIAEAG